MHAFILWCGFAGSWLLFAGPVYQAALELGEVDIDREAMHAAYKDHTPRPPVSPWWWLIPPAGYYLTKRRSRLERRDVMALWTPELQTAFIALTNKATGWIFVAGGGSLLAINETWNLTEHFDWSAWVFWVLSAVMVWLSAANTAVRLRRRPSDGRDRSGIEKQAS